MLQPFFSIIIPTFNRASLLPKAIESVLAQTFDNWELIIIDDGSTDNTAQVVKNYADERIKYIYQTNAERSAARNNGVDHARANYICFLDSDDYYIPNRLALIHAELIKRNCPVAMFYTNYVMDRDGKLYSSAVNYSNEGRAFDNIAANIIHSQQVCISAEILKEFRYDRRFRIGEDMELWLRIARKYPVTYFAEQNTIAVVDHEDRSVNFMKHNSGEDQLKLYRYLFSEEHSGKTLSPKLKLFLLSGAYHTVTKYYIHQGNRLAAISAIIKAINADRQSIFLKFRINILLKLATFSSMNKLKKLLEY